MAHEHGGKKSSTVRTVGVAIASAALGAAAAHFLGKHGKRNRERAKQWAVTTKQEVLAQAESMKTITREHYNQLVEKAVERYRALEDVGPKELVSFKKELKAHWKNIEEWLNKRAK